jgi:outer membrane immunogenic protein
VGGVAAAVAAGVIPVGFSTDPDGALGGIQIGYNYQVNPNWVVGAETDFSFSSLKGEQTINTAVTPAFLPITNTVWQRLDWFGTIRARLGFAANNWLFYATAGGAYGHLKYSYTQYNLAFGGAATAAVNAIGSESNLEWGWTAGGGIEYGWARWTLRAEYLYLDLGNHSFDVPQNTAPTAIFTPNFENKYHIVRAALSYHF